MRRITGSWLRKGDSRNIVAKIVPNLRHILTGKEFQLDEIRFGTYELYINQIKHTPNIPDMIEGSRCYDPNIEYLARFKDPNPILAESLRRELLESPEEFLNLLGRRRESGPDVYLSHLGLRYATERANVQLEVTPLFFYESKPKFIFSDDNMGFWREHDFGFELVVEIGSSDRKLERDIKNLYRTMRDYELNHNTNIFNLHSTLSRINEQS